MQSVDRAAQALTSQTDGSVMWLLYDFRGNNEYLWQMVGRRASMTRRCFLAIYPKQQPVAVIHEVDKPQFPKLDGVSLTYYKTWQDFQALVSRCISGYKSVALEYSPMGELPTVSMVDGGFIELVRSFSAQVVSSAPLFQETLATWDDDGLASHKRACLHVEQALRQGLQAVRQSIRAGNLITEYDVQQEIMTYFHSHGLESEDSAIVAVSRNSGDPHYEPSPEVHSPIKKGDLLLIDLWAREWGEENIYADVTWMAFVGDDVPAMQTDVFDAVRTARDAVVRRLQELWSSGNFSVQGWELDDVASEILRQRGYGNFIKHRTGHSIGPGRFLHALGVNIDNYETHDTRPVQKRVGFSVEPGLYTPDFGVRSEINVYVDPEAGPVVTTPIQDTIELLT